MIKITTFTIRKVRTSAMEATILAALLLVSASLL